MLLWKKSQIFTLYACVFCADTETTKSEDIAF